jgi:membrane associated rhomboid family serine protease
LGGLIPLSDASRRPRNFAYVTAAIIAVNAVVFLLELAGGDTFVDHWSMVPVNIVAGQAWITILTAMFMHASWSHIIGNMIFFWAFGPEIEDAMGPIRYLIFYLLGGLAATAAQVAVDPHSTVPNLGASGAIAAIMGAFLVTFPRDKIKSVLIGGWFLIQLVSFGAITNVPTSGASGGGGGVAYMAHIGGIAFGAIFARLFEHADRIAAQRAFNDYE